MITTHAFECTFPRELFALPLDVHSEAGVSWEEMVVKERKQILS